MLASNEVQVTLLTLFTMLSTLDQCTHQIAVNRSTATVTIIKLTCLDQLKRNLIGRALIIIALGFGMYE